ILSITLMSGAYFLSWREAFPLVWRWPGLFAALAFPPFQFFALRGGQVSAFGCFVLALSFFLRRRSLLAGLALSLCLYKPTLLVFILPMLIITMQWKTVAGFVLGGVALALLSFLLVGTEGINGYFKILQLMSEARNAPHDIFQTWMCIDLGSAFRLVTGRPLGVVRMVILLITMIAVVPYWLKVSPNSGWAAALTGTLLFGVYAPIYDASLLVLVVMWSGPKWLGTKFLLVLFFVSALPGAVISRLHIQLMTPLLAWLMWKLWKIKSNELTGATARYPERETV